MEENRIPKRVLYMNLGTTRFIHSFIYYAFCQSIQGQNQTYRI